MPSHLKNDLIRTAEKNRYVDLLIRLKPLPRNFRASKRQRKMGFLEAKVCGPFSLQWQVRKPANAPAGLAPVSPRPIPESGSEEMYDFRPEGAIETTTSRLPGPDLAARVFDGLKDTSLFPIEGGPVAVPLASLPYLWLIPLSCAPQGIEMALLVEPARALEINWPKSAQVSSVKIGERGFHLGFYPRRVDFVDLEKRVKQLTRLAGTFKALPAGTRIELDTMVHSVFRLTRKLESGSHRYAGILEGNLWRITHTYPRMRPVELAGALKLFLHAGGSEPFIARSAREVSEVQKMAEHALKNGNYGFYQERDLPKSDKLKMTITKDYRPVLAMMLFRLRFANSLWDVRSSRMEEDSRTAFIESLKVRD